MKVSEYNKGFAATLPQFLVDLPVPSAKNYPPKTFVLSGLATLTAPGRLSEATREKQLAELRVSSTCCTFSATGMMVNIDLAAFLIRFMAVFEGGVMNYFQGTRQDQDSRKNSSERAAPAFQANLGDVNSEGGETPNMGSFLRIKDSQRRVICQRIVSN